VAIEIRVGGMSVQGTASDKYRKITATARCGGSFDRREY
jgi:hypothetical protein